MAAKQIPHNWHNLNINGSVLQVLLFHSKMKITLALNVSFIVPLLQLNVTHDVIVICQSLYEQESTVCRQKLIIFYFNTECSSNSKWQECNNKRYFLGTDKMDFDSLSGYCNTMVGSVPADFGSKMAQSIATFFLPCRLSKTDNEPYWINKQSK